MWLFSSFNVSTYDSSRLSSSYLISSHLFSSSLSIRYSHLVTFLFSSLQYLFTSSSSLFLSSLLFFSVLYHIISYHIISYHIISYLTLFLFISFTYKLFCWAVFLSFWLILYFYISVVFPSINIIQHRMRQNVQWSLFDKCNDFLQLNLIKITKSIDEKLEKSV